VTFTARRERFRALLAGGRCVVPASVFDALSARLAGLPNVSTLSPMRSSAERVAGSMKLLASTTSGRSAMTSSAVPPVVPNLSTMPGASELEEASRL